MSQKLRPLSKIADFQVEHPLSEQLPYWDFGDLEVILVDGSIVAGLDLKGLAIEALDSNHVNKIATELRSLLNSLPDGCELSLISNTDESYSHLLSRHEALKGSSPVSTQLTVDRVKAIGEEIRSKSLLRSSLQLHVYQRHQTSKDTSKLSFFSTPKKFTQRKKEDFERAVTELHQTVDTISGFLSTSGISTRKMSGMEMWGAIYSFLNSKSSDSIPPKINTAYRQLEFTPEEVRLVPELSTPSPRQQLVASDLVSRYDSLFFGGYFHRAITLSTLPEFTHSALSSKLMQLPFPHALHVHLRVPPQSKELASLQARRRMAHSMSLSQGGRATDIESEARLSSAEELLRELINSGQKIFYFQCVVLLKAPTLDELDMQTKAVLAKFRELNGAEAISETVSGFKVWKSILPFGNVTMVRPKRIKADNLADFLPLYQPYDGMDHGSPVCLFRNRANGLVQYDPFSSRLPNYNTLVTGSSGAGKSFVNNLVLLQYVSQDPLIYIIDIGGSYRKLCEALDGQYVELLPPSSNETTKIINPFHLSAHSSAPTPQKLKFLMGFMESILSDEKSGRLPKLEKSLLEEALIQLYASSQDGKAPTMGEFTERLSRSQNLSLQSFSKMLYPWTGSRPYGRLLDGENDFDVSKNVVVFDLKGLSQYPDLQSVMLLIITDFILGRVESEKGRRKQILMDECWELLKSSGSQNFMEYCVRTLRKSGSGITFITQGLEEIVSSPIGPAILSNTSTKFVLMQRGDLEPIRNVLKLNDQEMSLISSLRQVKGSYSEAFLMANESRTVIRAVPTPTEYWLATSDAADNELLQAERMKTSSLMEAIQNLAASYPQGAAFGRKN